MTIEFTNPQSLSHDVKVEDASGEEVGATELIADSKTTATTDSLKPGDYTFYCSVPGHREAGMEGDAHRRIAVRDRGREGPPHQRGGPLCRLLALAAGNRVVRTGTGAVAGSVTLGATVVWPLAAVAGTEVRVSNG